MAADQQSSAFTGRRILLVVGLGKRILYAPMVLQPSLTSLRILKCPPSPALAHWEKLGANSPTLRWNLWRV